MSFDGYQPEPSDEPMTSPKGGSGVPPQPRYECWFDILDKLESIEKRLSALENKTPTYVPPPVYGPITYQCPHCGVVLHGSEYHVCGDFTHLITDDQTHEVK